MFSSRKIARKLHEDVAFRVLGAGNFPKHRTLCDFRALHLDELAGLFVQVVKLAGECGLVKLGTIAVDGTKRRAKASKATWRKNRAMADGRIDRQRGRKADPAVAEAQRTAKLTRENERLRRQLAQARMIIDVQKNV